METGGSRHETGARRRKMGKMRQDKYCKTGDRTRDKRREGSLH